MRTRFLSLAASLALCSLALPGPARTKEAAPLPAEAAAEPVRPALWKVADEDTTIWLFGTIHVLPEAVDWNSGAVAQALAASDTLVTEVPMDAQARTQAIMMRLSQREDGKNLRDTLTSEHRTSYEAALRKLGLPLDAFDRTDSWFAALMLSLLPLQAAGYDLAHGVDTQVSELAKARGMDHQALETPEYQLGQFENLSPETQETYLAEVIEGLPTMEADITEMVGAWRAGKAQKLAQILNEQESDPAIREALLTTRNRNWTAWLEERLETPGEVFVAVGAGHLAGKDSVQDLLAREGITAERIQ
ncbi:TraB/GumN family protein [Novosphingobium decolorationis]|uniref:TraB/GumN family protein n=1 Tax=Novosphingobium decolorationis TaxID=2698673 RepID=A0ABX8E2W5_9SPHN|nr:TraB/GumN family protein [Novosphingobium decolorationis]QVM82526.1 TraB/GumN family protein [Novosphingobium decolorationis]